MAEKPIKGHKDKKDKRDEEKTEDLAPLLDAGDRKKKREEKSTAEGSKPSTSKEGKKSKPSTSKEGKKAKPSTSKEDKKAKPSTSKEGKKKVKPSTSGKTEDTTPRESARIPSMSFNLRPIVIYEVDSAHKHFYEVRPLLEANEPISDPEDPANIERPETVQSFLPADDGSTSESYHPSRHVTGIIAEISRGESRAIETIPMAQVAQRGVIGASIGDLVVSHGLMAAALSTPNVPGARLAEEASSSTDATDGKVLKNISGESTDDKAKHCKEASPAKKTKAEILSTTKKGGKRGNIFPIEEDKRGNLFPVEEGKSGNCLPRRKEVKKELPE